jgi:Fe-S cluster assembly iron-binding protein IscA
MRVIPAGPGERGCEVVFTLRRRAGVTDEEFEADAAAVAADLAALRRLVEEAG